MTINMTMTMTMACETFETFETSKTSETSETFVKTILQTVTLETLITILTIQNPKSWQSLLPDNQVWHWTASAILQYFTIVAIVLLFYYCSTIHGTPSQKGTVKILRPQRPFCTYSPRKTSLPNQNYTAITAENLVCTPCSKMASSNSCDLEFYIWWARTCALASRPKKQREAGKDGGQTSASRIIMRKE